MVLITVGNFIFIPLLMTMKTTNVYDIYFDRDNGYVVMDWDGYATSAQFKEGTVMMLQVLMENKASKVLADTRDMDIIGLEDQQWIENVFLPNAIDKGFKAIAIVRPESYFNAVAMESVSSKITRHNVHMRIFDDAEEAKNWLKNLRV